MEEEKIKIGIQELIYNENYNIPENFFLVNSFHNGGKPMLFENPLKIISGERGESLETALVEIEKWRRSGHYIICIINYEALQNHENLDLLSCEPIYYFAIFNNFRLIDINKIKISNNVNIFNINTNISYRSYYNNFNIIKNKIISGLLYQINYTFKLNFETTNDGLDLYFFLRDIFPTDYSCYFKINNNYEILSFSPELFFKLNNSEITVKPMKGTGIKSDIKSLKSEKIKAENYMIVDLLRNDLGKISEHGSVKVKNILKEELYDKLVQLTSEVSSNLKYNTTIYDIIKSIFPSGSITGAPKLEAMKWIDKLENDKRGIYTGTIGLIKPDSDSVFSVSIRTIVKKHQKCTLGIGGGIVYDSEPRSEWNEALLKGSFIFKGMNIEIFESILLKNNTYYFKKEHIERMEKTSNILFGNFSKLAVLKTLDGIISPGRFKVKIYINKEMDIRFEKTEIYNKKRDGFINIGSTKLKSNNPLISFKTTYREMYDLEFKKKLDVISDTIFLNEDNLVIEGCISNIFIFKNGRYITPPIDLGLLPGVYRNKLLEKFPNHFIEEKITIEDLYVSDKIFICNSIKGIIKVKLYDK